MALHWPQHIERSIEVYINDSDKEEVEYDEYGYAHYSSSSSTLAAEGNHTSEKKLIRKVDLRLLPILGALYAISLIDRVNVRWSLKWKRNLPLTVPR